MLRIYRPLPEKSGVRLQQRTAIAFIAVAVLPHKRDGDGNARIKTIGRFNKRVTAAVGLSKRQALSTTQAQMCEVMLTKRLEKFDFQIDQIKDAEFIGIYEMVTEELLPLG